MAFQVHRALGNQPDPFESWFELDVFLRVARRGYRVIPQFEIAGCRIDLVVQGMDGSLAVECDGDAWHGVDSYEEDAARQRDLERCGWTFWRVRESVFRLDPGEALRDLWETLKAHGVLPTAVDEPRGEDASPVSEPLTVPDAGAAHSEGSTSVHLQGDHESDSERFAEQSSRGSGSPHPTTRMDRPGGTFRMPPTDVVPDRLSDDERVLPSQPTLQLSRREARPLNAGAVDGLAPYVEWESSGSVPDPRTASQEELASLLADIARREGPVVAIRAYRLINRASGRQRLTTPARRALNRACAAAVRIAPRTHSLLRVKRNLSCGVPTGPTLFSASVVPENSMNSPLTR